MGLIQRSNSFLNIVSFKYCENPFSRYFTNINFHKSSYWKNLANIYIFENQTVRKLTLTKINDLSVKGLFSLNKYKQDYIMIKSCLKLFYCY